MFENVVGNFCRQNRLWETVFANMVCKELSCFFHCL